MNPSKKNEQERLERLVRIGRYEATSLSDLLGFALGEILALTKSRLGYIFFYSEAMRQFTLNVWSESTGGTGKIADYPPVYDLEQAGLWGEAFRLSRPVVINDSFAPELSQKSHPEIGFPVKRFLSIPVFNQGKIVAVAGLVNKKSRYTDAEVHQTALMMDAIWPIAQRQENQDTCNQSRQALQMAIEAIPEEIHPKKDGEKINGISGDPETISDLNKNLLRIARLAAIVESSENAIIGVSTDGIVTDWNNAASGIIGYEESEVIGRPLSILFPPDKQSEIDSIMASVKSGQQHIPSYETRWRHKNGRTFFVSLILSPIWDKGHQPAGVSIIGRDITERKKNEAELERYRNFIENIGDGCFEIDMAGTVTYVNEVIEKRMGYTRGELIGASSPVYAGTDEAQRLFDIFKRIYETGEPATIDDFVVRDKDGSTRYISMTVSLIRDAEGFCIGFRGTTRDVTEKKRMKDDLEHSEARYRNMFENNKAVMLLIDPDTGCIIDANQAACHYYQYSHDEMLAMKITDINALSREEVLKEMIRAQREERSHFFFEHRLATGEIRPVEVFSGPIEVGGKMLLYSIIHDITDRRKAEQAMRCSEEKYRTILENISEGYIEHDLTGNFQFANNAACRILGYSTDELTGMNYRQIVTEETAKRMFDIYHQIYKTGEMQPLLDFEIINKDGDKILVELNVMLMRSNQGLPVGFRVMARDVTQRRKAEDDLRKSEEKYRSILENISEGYFECDIYGNIVFVNDSGCAMIGYDRETLFRTNYRQFTTPETKKKLQTTFQTVIETGEHTKMEDYEIIRADGAVRVHQLNVKLIRDDAGKPSGFRVVARDVTGKKQAEESLRRSEEKYRSILDSIMEGYFEYDLAGVITFANDAACTMMGYPREELLNMDYRKIASPQAAKVIDQSIRDIAATGVSHKLVDYEIIRRDGTRRIHQYNLSLIRNPEGKLTGARAMGRDVTELKWAEEALRQSEERIRLLFRNIPVPTFVWKAQHDQYVLSEFNSAAFQFIGDKIIDALGKPAQQFFAGMPQITADIAKCMDLKRNYENQFWYNFDDRSEKRYVIVKYAFAPPDSVLMHVNDITGQKRAEENLQFISIHDSLTGLFNRFYSDAEISRLAASRMRPVSVIIIDLNNLKKVNDEYGHAMGDLYIKNSASILKQTFRPEDMIARIGGDEFLILLPLVDEDTCAQAVERLHENIRLFNREGEFPISLATGFATTRTGDHLLERIREADRRMYEDKAAYKASCTPSLSH